MATHSNMISHHIFIIDAQNIPEIAGVCVCVCGFGVAMEHRSPVLPVLGCPGCTRAREHCQLRAQTFAFTRMEMMGLPTSIYTPYQMKNNQV